LASRCAKYRFKPLDSVNTKARIEYIAEQEHVQMEDGVVDALVQTSEGDLRKAITYLQASAKLFGGGRTVDGDVIMSEGSNEVTVSSIHEIAGVVPHALVESLLQACQPGKIGLYSRVSPVVDDIVAEGWSAGAIIMQVPTTLTKLTLAP
jgi:replication factor C subunit 2/4